VIIACSHPNGLNLGGVVARGPAVDPQTPVDLRPETYAGYAFTEAPDGDRGFVQWVETNKDSPILTDGVVVWGVNRDEVRLKILNGRQGRGYVA
jgi:hypothetical protein